jgi:hypothetical protein
VYGIAASLARRQTGAKARARRKARFVIRAAPSFGFLLWCERIKHSLDLLGLDVDDAHFAQVALDAEISRAGQSVSLNHAVS